MAEEDKDIVSFESFSEYMQTLKGEHVCPMCLEEQWSLFTPDGLFSKDKSKIIPTIPGLYFDKETRQKDPSLLKSDHLNVLIMQCINCGYMNFFNYKKVLSNLNSGDYVKEEDGEGKDDSEEE